MKKKELVPLNILIDAYKIIEDISIWDNHTKYYHLSDEWVLKFRPYRNIAILQKYQQKSLTNLIFEIVIYQRIKKEKVVISELKENDDV